MSDAKPVHHIKVRCSYCDTIIGAAFDESDPEALLGKNNPEARFVITCHQCGHHTPVQLRVFDDIPYYPYPLSYDKPDQEKEATHD